MRHSSEKIHFLSIVCTSWWQKSPSLIFSLLYLIQKKLTSEYHHLYQKEFDHKPKIDMLERRKEKAKKVSRSK